MRQAITRRDFVKSSIGLAAGAAVACPGKPLEASALGPARATAPQAEWRNKLPEMRYRRLGRTGFMISEIVCGGDPISPANNRHVELALDMGLNYLDTAPAYGGGQSEMGYAAVIQGSKRDRVFVNTKISPFSGSRFDAYRKIFESVSAAEQAAVLAEASEDIGSRRVTVPNYFGNYFNGQIRQVEEVALANAMEKRYGAKIDRPRWRLLSYAISRQNGRVWKLIWSGQCTSVTSPTTTISISCLKRTTSSCTSWSRRRGRGCPREAAHGPRGPDDVPAWRGLRGGSAHPGNPRGF